MQSTLTLQEEELARTLKSQGRSTQDIMGAIAKQRTGGIDRAQSEQTKEQGFSALFNVDAAKDVFNRAGQDVNLAADAGFGKFATTAVLQGGTAPFRAVGEGIFGTEKAQQATSAAVDGLTKFGDVITPEVVQDKVGSLALEAIAGYEQMNPQKQLTQRNKLAVAEVLSSFLGGATAKDTLIKPTLKGIEDTVQTATNDIADITSGITRPEVSAPIQTPLPPEVKATIVKGFDVAIKPNLSSKQTPVQLGRYNEQVARSIDTITNNRANLSYVDEATGETVTGRLPQNLKEYVDALEQTKQTIFQQYDDIAAKAGEVGAQVDTIAVANQLDEILNSKSLKLSNPEAVRYAEEVRGRLLSTKNLSTVDAQDVIRNYNKSLEAFYRNPTPEGLTRNAVDAMVANNLRKALDDEIAGITGAQYQALKSDYASLKTVERDIMRAFNRDARRNTKGLIDFTDVLTGGQVVSGILSMNPAIIGQGLAGKAVSTAIKMVNDPNRKVKQIFQEAGRYERPDMGASTPTRRQLPAPEPNAPRSEVSSGRTIEAGGQTERGQVTAGITERTREGAIRQSDGEAVPTLTEQALAGLKKAGVQPDEVKKALAGGTIGVLLAMYVNDDGSMLPAFGAVLAIGTTRGAKLQMVREAMKANNARRAAMSAGGMAENSSQMKAINKQYTALVAEQIKLEDGLSPGLGNKMVGEKKAKSATTQTNLLEEAKIDLQLSNLDPSDFETVGDFVAAYNKKPVLKSNINLKVLSSVVDKTVKDVLSGDLAKKYRAVADVKIETVSKGSFYEDSLAKNVQGQIAITEGDELIILVRPDMPARKLKEVILEEIDHAATYKNNPKFIKRDAVVANKGTDAEYLALPSEKAANRNVKKRLLESQYTKQELTDIWEQANQ